MSKRRDRKGLRVARGERYALIPREVLQSEAYRALPPWTVVVLLALAAQYYGCRNGSLALPFKDARELGVKSQAQLYGGLQLLEATDLVLCTRRGHRLAGRQLASLYALTWQPIDGPGNDIVYDGTISAGQKPTHTWARWTRPNDWNSRIREIRRRAKGKRDHVCPYGREKELPPHPVGIQSAHPVGSRNPEIGSPRGEPKMANPAHPVGVTSVITAGTDAAKGGGDL